MDVEARLRELGRALDRNHADYDVAAALDRIAVRIARSGQAVPAPCRGPREAADGGPAARRHGRWFCPVLCCVRIVSWRVGLRIRTGLWLMPLTLVVTGWRQRPGAERGRGPRRVRARCGRLAAIGASVELDASCEAVIRAVAATAELRAFVDERDPAGARTFACVCYQIGRLRAAESWWHYAAGADDPVAAYCLTLLHLSGREARAARHWKTVARCALRPRPAAPCRRARAQDAARGPATHPRTLLSQVVDAARLLRTGRDTGTLTTAAAQSALLIAAVSATSRADPPEGIEGFRGFDPDLNLATAITTLAPHA